MLYPRCRLNLIADIFVASRYHYLNLTENGKGKLCYASHNKELTKLQILIGLTLLDTYYQKYFEEEKIIHWNDIKTQILERTMDIPVILTPYSGDTDPLNNFGF